MNGQHMHGQHLVMSHHPALAPGPPRHHHHHTYPTWQHQQQQQRPSASSKTFSPLKSHQSNPSSSASPGLPKARYQTLIEVFIKLMKQQRSNQPKKVWTLARRIERRLFHDAPSLDVYLETQSMGRRLHHVVKTIMQEQQQQVQKWTFATASNNKNNNERRFSNTSSCESDFSKTPSTNNNSPLLPESDNTNSSSLLWERRPSSTTHPFMNPSSGGKALAHKECFSPRSQQHPRFNNNRLESPKSFHRSRQGLLLDPQILFHVMQYLSGIDTHRSLVPLTATTWAKIPVTLTSLRLTCRQLVAAFHTRINVLTSTSDHHHHMVLCRCYRLRFLTVVVNPSPAPAMDTDSVLAQLAKVLKVQKPFPVLERLHLLDLLPSKELTSIQLLLDTLRMNACPQLTDLNLSGNALEDTIQVTSTLFRPPFFQQPQQHQHASSALSNNNQHAQHPPQAQLQRRTRYFKGLSKLNLRRNKLSDSGIQSLCQAMTMGACESLTCLDLGDNHLTDRAIEDLVAAFRHQRLPNFEFLGLSGNYLTSASVERLARCVVEGHCPKLQSIALRRNDMQVDPHELFLNEIRKAHLWQEQEKYPHLVHQQQPHRSFPSHYHHNPQQHINSSSALPPMGTTYEGLGDVHAS